MKTAMRLAFESMDVNVAAITPMERKIIKAINRSDKREERAKFFRTRKRKGSNRV